MTTVIDDTDDHDTVDDDTRFFYKKPNSRPGSKSSLFWASF